MANEIYFRDNAYQDLIAAPKTITGAWANLGPLIQTGDMPALSLWLKYTINDTTGLKIRILSKRSISDAESFENPTLTVSSGGVLVTPEVFFLPASSMSIGFPIPVSDLFGFMQLQIMATVPGATPASLTLAQIYYAASGRTV